MSACRYRVMVVDDDPALLRLLSMRLSAAGYEVAALESGEKAIAQVAIFQPHLVITDLRMDGMDGMALFDLLHRRSPALPVIILTAHGSIPDAVDATSRGVFGYLTKPFDSKDLLEQVTKALRVTGEQELRRDEEDVAEWRQEIV
ncbi:MAG: response regulator, partial [Gammaproteobacteria bacterium]